MAQSKRAVRKSRHRGSWTEDAMREAIKEVKKGAASIAKIGEKYGIPETSIRDWMSGKTSSKKRGPRTVLSKEEEESLVEWCMEMQRTGHSITFYMLRRKVAELCQGRETPFKNGMPGKSWMDWFRKRHPNVMIEPAHALKGKKRFDSDQLSFGEKRRKASPVRAMLPAEGMIGRVEEASIGRDLFGAAGSEPPVLDTRDPRDIMSQETHIEARITTTRRGVGEEGTAATPGYEPWRDHERMEGIRGGSESDGSESYPSSMSSGGRRRPWFEFAERLAGIERAIRESEDRKDRRLERQLEANERIAAGFINTLVNVAESLRTLGQRGLGPTGLGPGLGGFGPGLGHGLGTGLGSHPS